MTGSIPQEFIKEIIDSSNVVEIIEGYLPLKKKGKDHWGQCPFCDDGKNPSFSVSSLKQFYYCFKCRSTGNVIGFLQEFEGLSFIESVEALASKAGVEIPYQNLTGVREDKEPIFNILRSASDFFEDVLSQESSSKHVQKYIREERNVSGETSRRFSMGYAPKSWNSLTSHLRSKGFSDKLLIKAGLSKVNKEKELYDVFRDRLMFPIKDRKGRVLGFGGRIMNFQDNPKYLNTGDTKVFQKGRELYGLYETLKVRKNLKRIFVVEGYIDVVAMSENHINNSVATLGIATNRFHIQTLLQLVNEIVFCFDGDDAGRGAAWGALKNTLPVISDGNEIKFLFLPEGEDPASILEKENKQKFEERIKKSLLLSEYFIERLSTAIGSRTIEKKAALASKAMDLLKTMPESSIKKLLEIEVSNITGLNKEDINLLAQSKPVRQKRRGVRSKKLTNQENQESAFEEEGLISKTIGALIAYPSLSVEVESVQWIKELQQPEANLLILVIEYFKSDPKGQVADLLTTLDKEAVSFIGTLIVNSPILEKKDSLVFFQDCLRAMRKTNPDLRIKELKLLLKERNLSEEETFELQQHLLSKLDNLEEDNRTLLRHLSQSGS